MSTPTAYEQYMLELINKERTAAGVQPLAFDGDLNESAEVHSNWMIDSEVFSHTGDGGSNPDARMTAAGYQFGGSWGWGENIAWTPTNSPAGDQDEVDVLHTNLMNSPGHRANILTADFREIGIGFEDGDFQANSSAVVTQNFARTGTNSFLTGVAFDDKNGDQSYDVGEGLGGIKVQAVSDAGTMYTTTTYDSGGYDLEVPDGTYTLTFSGPGIAEVTKTVVVGAQNVKIDLVDPAASVEQNSPTDPLGTDPTTSSDPDSTDPATDEVAGVIRTGSGRNNTLEGDAGNDELYGRGGHDKLLGLAGDDLLVGGIGRDLLTGSDGEDTFDFNAVRETGRGVLRDIIKDFETGVDQIDLQGMDASRAESSNQDFAWVDDEDLGAAFTGEAGQLRFQSGVLMGDTDGDGRANFHIKVVGSLTADDVIL